MFSIMNRIRIDSLARIILIGALIAVMMNLAFVSVLRAENFEKVLDKKGRVVTPAQDDPKPGDADDIMPKTKLQIQQNNNGTGDYSRSSSISIDTGISYKDQKNISLILIFYRFVIDRSIVLVIR